MATSRFRAVFLFLLLALVLTTTGCRGSSASRSGHGSGTSGGGGLHLPWFSSSTHKKDPERSPLPVMPDPEEEFRAWPPDTPKGGWRAPLAPPLRVTRPFEPPPTPYAAGHRGVDLAGFRGQEVRSAGIGYVAWAGVLAGRGVIVVQHSELRTTYEPVAAVVTKGSYVQAGERIGILQRGHPGCPVAACLHWGLLGGTDYLDPMSLLADEVRLLPLGSGK